MRFRTAKTSTKQFRFWLYQNRNCKFKCRNTNHDGATITWERGTKSCVLETIGYTSTLCAWAVNGLLFGNNGAFCNWKCSSLPRNEEIMTSWSFCINDAKCCTIATLSTGSLCIWVSYEQLYFPFNTMCGIIDLA